MRFESLFKIAGIAMCLILLSAPLAGSAEKPVRGGNLVAVSEIEPISLDPPFGNAQPADMDIFSLIYEKLFYLDIQGKMQPQLATSWDFAKDGKSLVFNLRKGVKFHDGAPFNANAVKFSLERAIDPKLNPPHAKDLAAVASVDVLDDYKVRVNLKEASGAIIAGLGNEAGMMVSPAAVKKHGKEYGRHPVGTGPFMFKSWTGGDRVTVVANPNYWRKDSAGQPLPYLDSVAVRFIANTAVKILEAKSGNVQLVRSVQVKDFPSIEEDKSLVLLEKPIGTHQWLAFNVNKKPFDNKKLRLAVLHGIDRKALEKVISKGYGTITPTLVPPSEWIYDGSLKHPEYDVAKAKKYLAESGHKGPITISVIQRDPDTQIAQLIFHMMSQIGLEVKVEILERQAWVSKVVKGNHEIGLLRIGVPRADPAFVFTGLMGRKAGLNFSGYKNEEFFDLIDKAQSLLDRAERRKYYIKIQQHLLDAVPYGFLFLRPVKDIASIRLKGLFREACGSWILTEAYLEKQ